MFRHYFASAVRHFRQHKITTSINVACLAFGLACFLLAWGTAGYFTQADKYHARAERTYLIASKHTEVNLTQATTSWLLAEHLKTDFPQLEAVARVLYPREAALTAQGKSTFAAVSYADAQFTSIFDLPLLSGRRETALIQPRSAIVSRELAQRMFGTDQVLGRTLRLSGGREAITITGVLGAIRRPSHISTGSASIGLSFDALLSMDLNVASRRAHRWDQNWYYTYVVLPIQGLTAESFNAQLSAFADRNLSEDAKGTVLFRARPINEFTNVVLDTIVRADSIGASSTAILKVLGAMVLFVACLNYANLATAQAVTRAKEIALRKVIGARRSQVLSEYLIESTLLTCIALLLAVILVGLMLASMSLALLNDVVRLVAGMPQLWAGLFALVCAVGMATSAYPAYALSRIRPAPALLGARFRGVPRFVATLLVGVQFGAASFLLIAVLLMTIHYGDLKQAVWNPKTDPLVVVANDLSLSGVDQVLLKAELLRSRGVKAVTGIHRMPWTPGANGDPLAASADASAARMPANYSIVDADFFATLDIAVIAGRTFDTTRASDVSNIAAWHGNDAASAADYNVIVDRSLVERMGLGQPQQAVGKIIYRPTSQSGATPAQRLHIIGVVERSFLMPMGMDNPVFYMMNPQAAVVPIVRVARNDVAAALESMDRVWGGLTPETPLKRRFAEEQFEQSFAFLGALSSAFSVLAGFASLIAAVSLVGMALLVTRRRIHEIGVRKTLGASVQQILFMLITGFSKPVIIANIAVWPLAYIAMRGYLSMFAQTGTLTLTPFVLSLLLSLGITCAAVAGQSFRAARVRPSQVLRYE